MNQRDIERISEYLDGRLDSSDSARLEARLASDPALASTLDAMRESRALLRRMPKRRAPRNFTLTRQMVGLKPPLPRSYPVFRFATALATILFALSFVAKPIGQLAASAPAYGIGGGGGDAATEAPAMEMALATEPPAAPEESATEAPAPTEMALALPAPTESVTDQNRVAESPQESAAKNAGETPPPSPLLTQWQVILVVVAVLGAAAMLLIRQLAARKWRAK
ncbi:MAG: hypothetical protein ACOYZ6_03285 [Chloroflexota bacterium]